MRTSRLCAIGETICVAAAMLAGCAGGGARHNQRRRARFSRAAPRRPRVAMATAQTGYVGILGEALFTSNILKNIEESGDSGLN